MHKQKLSQAYYALTHWRDFRLKLFGEGIFIGFFVGFVIVAFRYALEQAEILRTILYQHLQTDLWIYSVLWFFFLFLIAYVLHRFIKLEPMSSGSGIPQVKGIILGLMKMRWLSVLITKFINGVLAIGAGLSLGREGPSVQLGAAVGQGISRQFGRSKLEENYLLTSGASAGLAAAFNAPLAGVIFSLEELHKNFSPAVLMSAVAAALTAVMVSQHFFGYNPVFNFVGLPVLPTENYWIVLLLGLLMGILGIGFNRCLIFSLSCYDHIPFSNTFKIALPLMFAGILGFLLPEVLGGGNHLVDELAENSFSFIFLIILFTVKFFFTMLSFGSGVPGGIFLPMLVIGALGGSVFSHSLNFFGQLDSYYNTTIIVFSMAAYFSAIVKSPITGSILIMEMTGSFQHMFPLIIVSMTAYLVTDIAKVKPIYEQLLERSLLKQGKIAPPLSTNDKIIIEAAVGINSALHGKQIKNIIWPPNSLLISIKRGDLEIIPKGNTKLMIGDYLYILGTPEQAQQLHTLADTPPN